MKHIVDLAKNRGFVFQGSEIYGGLANSWDYGPLGSLLKENIKNLWIREMIQKRQNMLYQDAAIIMHPKVWETSGHVGGFSDPLIDDKNTKERFRADKLMEALFYETEQAGISREAQQKDYTAKYGVNNMVPESWTLAQQHAFMMGEKVENPNTKKPGDWTEVRKFNLMFRTSQGVTEDSSSMVYLRPETAQGIFVNFPNIVRSSRKKIPFGVGQVGKAFRNEITPGNFIFRTREFEQMEIEFFCEPGTQLQWHEYWKEACKSFLTNTLGIKSDKLRFRAHEKDELSHYSDATFDIEYDFPGIGFSELWGIASRTDFDLTAHMKATGQDMSYFDPYTNTKYIPYVVEPAVGLTRLVLTTLCDAYDTVADGDEGGERIVLRLKPEVAPVKIAVLPLVKKLNEKAEEVFQMLSKNFMTWYDETGSIGKRYARFDEIGTPWCVTIDFDNTLEKNMVTIRHRDTMEQEVVAIEYLIEYFQKALQG